LINLTPSLIRVRLSCQPTLNETTMKKVLITGAGTGFGHEAAIRLAEKGFDVVATVEIWAQVQTLKRQVAARGVTLQVEKLDVK